MIRNNHDAGIKRTVVYWHKLSKMKIYADPRGGRGGEVLPYNHYLYGYPFQRRFLEQGIIFQTHESYSFVSNHLKLFKDRLLLKIRFNALTSKLLYSCCTLCFSVQGGRILARATSADSAILDK